MQSRAVRSTYLRDIDYDAFETLLTRTHERLRLYDEKKWHYRHNIPKHYQEKSHAVGASGSMQSLNAKWS